MSAEEKATTPTIYDTHLKEFQRNNPHCKFSLDEDKLIIENPWGDTLQIAIDSSDIGTIKDMNNIAFRPQFDAIIHVDKKEIEFIYGYVLPDKEPYAAYMNRCFQFYFKGEQCECSFREPTQRVFKLAQTTKRKGPGDAVHQLRAFRDAQDENLPEKIKKYFEKMVPLSFFVKTLSPILDNDLEMLIRHINFHMYYL